MEATEDRQWEEDVKIEELIPLQQVHFDPLSSSPVPVSRRPIPDDMNHERQEPAQHDGGSAYMDQEGMMPLQQASFDPSSTSKHAPSDLLTSDQDHNDPQQRILFDPLTADQEQHHKYHQQQKSGGSLATTDQEGVCIKEEPRSPGPNSTTNGEEVTPNIPCDSFDEHLPMKDEPQSPLSSSFDDQPGQIREAPVDRSFEGSSCKEEDIKQEPIDPETESGSPQRYIVSTMDTNDEINNEAKVEDNDPYFVVRADTGLVCGVIGVDNDNDNDDENNEDTDYNPNNDASSNSDYDIDSHDTSYHPKQKQKYKVSSKLFHKKADGTKRKGKTANDSPPKKRKSRAKPKGKVDLAQNDDETEEMDNIEANLLPEPDSIISVSSTSSTSSGKMPECFMCDTCGLILTTKKLLNNHKFQHEPERRYKCRYCERPFRFNNHRKRHEKQYCSLRWEDNTSQESESRDGEDDDAEEGDVNERAEIGDETEGNTSAKQTVVEQEIKSAGGESTKPAQNEESDQDLESKQVKKPEESTKTLRRKVHSQIEDEDMVQCLICISGSLFTSKEELRDHENKTHKILQGNQFLFKCDQCDKQYQQRFGIVNHVRGKHLGEKPFKCSLCDMAFTRKDVLKEHSIVHTGWKTFKCPVCNVSFARKGELQNHKRCHTGIKSLKCDVCGKKFREKSNLKLHLQTHSDEKPYKCGVCGKTFKVSQYLHVHAKTHTGVKPHKCKDCGRAFVKKNKLTEHEKIHDGRFLVTCEECGEMYGNLANLKVHKRNVHKIDDK